MVYNGNDGTCEIVAVNSISRKDCFSKQRVVMNIKKTIAWMLTLLTVGSSLIACGADTKDEEKDSQTEAQTQKQTEATSDESKELTPTEIRLLVTDGLKDVDYNQREFRMDCPTGLPVPEFIVEGETGDPCNDAVYKRNSKIEQRFNVIITLGLSSGGSSGILEAIQTDQDFTEVFSYGADRMYKFIGNKLLYNWHDVEIMNLDAIYYNQRGNESNTINGFLYTLASDLSVSTLTSSYATFFNTRLLQNYGYQSEDLYQMVEDGTWTFDQLVTLSKDIYEDFNLNNTRDQEDLYGYTVSDDSSEALSAYLPSFGHQFLIQNDDGTVTPNLLNDMTVAALDKVRDFFAEDGVNVIGWTDEPNEVGLFVDGLSVFTTMKLAECFDNLRAMEDQYSILPMPKYDEKQETYLTAPDPEYYLLALPKTVDPDDFDFVGTIVEALACESYRTVYPIFFDAALKGRYSKEPQTAKMMDYVERGRTFHLAQQFNTDVLTGLYTTWGSLTDEPKTPLASKWTTMERMFNVKLPTFLDLYEDSGY